MNHLLKTVMIVTFVFCFMFASFAQAEIGSVSEDMTQGDFALWLVRAVGAMYKLPPGANDKDAVAFLTTLGLVPQGNWQTDEKISKEFLASLLDIPDSEKEALLKDPQGFDKLLQKVKDLLQSRFDDARQGVFRVQSASASSPA